MMVIPSIVNCSIHEKHHYFASNDPHQLGLELSGIWWGLYLFFLSGVGGGADLRRPGAPAVGDMWGLYLFFLSGVWGGGRGKEKERRSGEEEKSNNPNLKGGE